MQGASAIHPCDARFRCCARRLPQTRRTSACPWWSARRAARWRPAAARGPRRVGPTATQRAAAAAAQAQCACQPPLCACLPDSCGRRPGVQRQRVDNS